MTRAMRDFRSISALLALLGLLAPAVQATAAIDAQAQAALAEIRGTVAAPGLHQPVRVQRDKWGVAHIYASDTHDLFFAQGFVAAQDRLFQMELWKRAGQGRLPGGPRPGGGGGEP